MAHHTGIPFDATIAQRSDRSAAIAVTFLYGITALKLVAGRGRIYFELLERLRRRREALVITLQSPR